MRSPIFRKILAGAILLILPGTILLDLYLTGNAARRETEQTKRRLEAMARLMAHEMTSIPPSGILEWTRAASSRARARVTVIDPEGNVIGESDRDPTGMENHSGRPEVREAEARGVGSAIRRSASINLDLCYLALSVGYGGRPGYILRLAYPLEHLENEIAEVRRTILLGSAAAVILALILAYFLSTALVNRINRIRRFAEGLVAADFESSLPPEPADELGALARSLNGMARQMRELLDRLGLESARREAILSSMVEGVLAVDADLRVTFCNAAFARLIGSSAEVPANTPVMQLVRDPELLSMLNLVLSSGKLAKQRILLPAADGRAFEVQAAPLSTASQRGVITILHDITDLERLERVRRDFVANVSHELRTPLTAIRGYAETLLEGALEDPENSRRFVEIIQAHSIRLNSIASDLLTLSALDAGTSSLDAETITLRESIETALRTVETEARLRQVRILRGEFQDVQVRGDRMRVEQMAVNLLDNAVKFNLPGGQVVVEVKLTPEGEALLQITDTGIGIPSTELPRIFERFYRVDKARSREVGGTGLGLSIVRHIVERMGGTISVESELGKGTRFDVILPSVDAAA